VIEVEDIDAEVGQKMRERKVVRRDQARGGRQLHDRRIGEPEAREVRRANDVGAGNMAFIG
jgi:hypothetical protein